MNWGGVDGISGQFPAAARKPPPFPAFVITAEFTNFEKCSFWPGGNALKSFFECTTSAQVFPFRKPHSFVVVVAPLPDGKMITAHFHILIPVTHSYPSSSE